jgi:hypothetical protein
VAAGRHGRRLAGGQPPSADSPSHF